MTLRVPNCLPGSSTIQTMSAIELCRVGALLGHFLDSNAKISWGLSSILYLKPLDKSIYYRRIMIWAIISWNTKANKIRPDWHWCYEWHWCYKWHWCCEYFMNVFCHVNDVTGIMVFAALWWCWHVITKDAIDTSHLSTARKILFVKSWFNLFDM